MACESFVITSDCGGLSEQVENGVTGRLVTAGSVDELYGAMKQVVDNGVDERIVINARNMWRAFHGVSLHCVYAK